jgi:hypothetical protein
MHTVARARGSIGILVLAGSLGCGSSMTEEQLRGPSLTTSSAALVSAIGRQRCATPDPDADEVAAAESFVAAQRAQARTADKQPARIRVPVYFHVITSSQGEGDVSALIPAQMDVLNAAYAVARVHFDLVAIEVTANDEWYTADSGTPEERHMKRALRQGGADTLNIYTNNTPVFLGWATFPSSYANRPQYDGVVVLNLTLPGGGLEIPVDPALEPDGIINYSAGNTLTHEAGHWFGLFHTFEHGCSNKGDSIDDTPAEAEPQFYCVDRDSCTQRRFPGTDPIHNFMDYVDDDCMDQFTPLQYDRAREQFLTFRRPG